MLREVLVIQRNISKYIDSLSPAGQIAFYNDSNYLVKRDFNMWKKEQKVYYNFTKSRKFINRSTLCLQVLVDKKIWIQFHYNEGSLKQLTFLLL